MVPEGLAAAEPAACCSQVKANEVELQVRVALFILWALSRVAWVLLPGVMCALSRLEWVLLLGALSKAAWVLLPGVTWVGIIKGGMGPITG